MRLLMIGRRLLFLIAICSQILTICSQILTQTVNQQLNLIFLNVFLIFSYFLCHFCTNSSMNQLIIIQVCLKPITYNVILAF